MEIEQEERKRILKKIRRTGRNETLCLAGWEAEILKDYLDRIEKAIESIRWILTGKEE